MIDGRCNHAGCKEIATHRIWVDFNHPQGAQLLFPDLAFCEEHAREMKYTDLIFPEQIENLFDHLGRTRPDFTKTVVKTAVMQGVEVV